MKADLEKIKSGLLKALSPLIGGTCVGVDIGSAMTKAIYCNSSRVPLTLSKASLQIMGGEQTPGKIKQSFTAEGLTKKAASLSIADEKVENHEFRLPKLAPKELETAIDWEIKKAVTSAEFAFHDVMTNDNPDGVDVQCIVASKDIVQSRFDEGTQLGLVPRYLETESAALMALAKLTKPDRNISKAVIMDLGYSAFRFTFIHDNRVTFTRSLYLGLGPMLETVWEKSAQNLDEMVRVMKLVGQDVEEARMNPVVASLERALQETLYTLVEEFSRSEYFAKDQKQLAEVDEVFLCGGGACIPFTVTYIAEHLGERKINVLDPFKMAKQIPKGVDPMSGPLWACAAGLSLRDVT